MKILRSITEPIRKDVKWGQKWDDVDQGLIACWERGREKAIEDPELASQTRDGHLVVLPWKGGVEKENKNKKKKKYGTLPYLAMWQGLRGEGLDIDLEDEPTLTCSKNKMTVIFTNDKAKYAEP
ncbi:MAG: hypothetical protein NTU74_02335 [Deltaproteobacteria bacterium]|nr:hypothetical protein [Deltaproteobacteria bacterium]